MSSNPSGRRWKHLWTKIRPLIPSRRRPSSGPVVIDIGSDRRGEFFDIQATQDADVQVLDVQPKDRHLLLMVRQSAERPGLPDTKDKFLCGHDERHWFVADVPESAPVSSVITAKEALKPELVRSLESGQICIELAGPRCTFAASIRTD